jgi:hypothetical protein
MRRRVTVALFLIFGLAASANPARADLLLPSAGGSGFHISTFDSWDSLIHFDAPFTGEMSFEYRVTQGEAWPVRPTAQYLATGSCSLGPSTCPYGPGYSQDGWLWLVGLPFRDERYSPMIWQLSNIQTLDFSIGLRTADVLLQDITVTPLVTPLTPVPEPSTLILLCSGLLACRRLSRRPAAPRRPGIARRHAETKPSIP